ncbi:hypothetical protein BJ165DRAFT_1534722 [Panaeolus papilionaceus]|nr:hypothetical protein BJ165DRAFT_1534722 [Panaeolus papilionaceus]
MSENEQSRLCRFSQVRHVYLDDSSSLFASMCPKLISWSSTSDSAPRYHALHCPWERKGEETIDSLEVLKGIYAHDNVYRELHQFPNLRDITMEVNLAELLVRLKDEFDLSGNFRHLRIIRIRADQFFRFNSRVPDIPKATDVEQWVKWAEGLLRRIQRFDKQVKKVYLTVHSGDQTLYLLEPGLPTQSLRLPPL